MTIRDRFLRALRNLTGATFRAEVLKALADLGGRSDVVRIGHKLTDPNGRSPSQGKVRATLERLEAAGKVKSESGTVRYPERGNRPRKYYQIVKPKNRPNSRLFR